MRQRRRTAVRELEARALRSRKFRRWGRVRGRDVAYKKPRVLFDPTDRHEATEHHFTPTELGTIWGLSAETIRGLFEKETGVLIVATTAKGRRRYRTFRIPERVAIRVHNRLSP